MQELLDGKLAPVTYTFGFMEMDSDKAVNAFVDWQTGVQASRGVSVRSTRVAGNLSEVLSTLLPLTSVEARRFLLIPTQGPWTAYLSNDRRSTDAVTPMSYLARTVGCRALRVTYVPPDAVDKRFPANILEIYGAEPTHFLNYIRSIALAYDGKKWTFSLSGSPQPFEDTERYKERSLTARFTPGMLQEYLTALGVDAFSSEFYRPDHATLLYKEGPIAPAAKEFTLASLRQ